MEKVEYTEIEKKRNAKREVYYTPESALQLLHPYIKQYKAVWDPACGTSSEFPLKNFFEKEGHRLIHSDISMGKDHDFLTTKTKKRFDIIVTAPPYSFRKEFLVRVLELGKPFAFLVPSNVLESRTIRDLFSKTKVSLLFPPRNTSFITPDNNKSVKGLPYCLWVLGNIDNLPEIIYLRD